MPCPYRRIYSQERAGKALIFLVVGRDCELRIEHCELLLVSVHVIAEHCSEFIGGFIVRTEHNKVFFNCHTAL